MSRRELTPAQRAAAYSRKLDERIARGHRDLAPGETPAIGPLKSVGDTELIMTLIGVGMPLVNARALEHNPQQRFLALRVWADVDAAGRGDSAARERVDMIRERFQQMRRDELIADDPKRVITIGG